MLNSTGIKKESYLSNNQILFATDMQVSVGVLVSNTVQPDANALGRKIVKAGTPLTGNLEARETAFTKSATGTDVVGILLHDVDVTAGDTNGTLLLFGFVNTNRLDTATKALITADVKSAIPMIKFVGA